MPLGNFPRRMTVVGLGRNRTASYSAHSARRTQMGGSRSWGRPHLIVPNGSHRLDRQAVPRRYPAKIVTAPGPGRRSRRPSPVRPATRFGTDAELHHRRGVRASAELAMIGRAATSGVRSSSTTSSATSPPRRHRRNIMARMFGFGPHRKFRAPSALLHQGQARARRSAARLGGARRSASDSFRRTATSSIARRACLSGSPTASD